MPYRLGLGDIDARLAEARSAVERAARLARLRAAAERDRDRLTGERDEHAGVLAKQTRGVDKLEGTSLRSLFYGILGKREERLADEKEALLRSTLMHQLLVSELAAVEAQLDEIAAQEAAVEGAAERLAGARGDKAAWMSEHAGPAGEQLFKMSEEAGRLEALLEEIDEASRHGETALTLTDQVLGELASARNWGTFDMLGGGLLATMAKHDKIDSARQTQALAQEALLAFSRELRDVEIQIESAEAIEIDSFNKFGDYFFDGLIFDWSVQSKIKRSEEAVAKTRASIASAVSTLAEQRQAIGSRLEELVAGRLEFIDAFGR